MLLTQTILLTLVALLAKSEYLLGTSLIQRPIVIGPLVGLIMGDLIAGITMGATLELAFIGAVSIGAYIPPDMISGTILGIAFAINAGTGAESALALGMPIATIMLALNTILGSPIMLFYTHLCDKNAEKGEDKKLQFNAIFGGYLSTCITVPIISIAYYFGSDAVTSLLGNIPDFIQTGMNIACGLIPALGFAMLAQMIMNKKVAPYFFLGYFLVAYFEIPTTAVAIFAAVIVALVVTGKMDRKKNVTAETNANAGEVTLDEF
ncbi:MAG: PTS sugar transporter subunit IIC [Erysipelotrichia bacterium]|nr:PTS sugar transporter subunit IIC [Erysipelotrichia bacterium]